jgi:hypothetical protein
MWLKKILFSVEVFIVSLTLVAFLWLTTVSVERQKNFQLAEINAKQIKNSLEAVLNARVLTITQFSTLWWNSQSLSHDDFIRISREIIYKNPGIKMLEYRDDSNHVWIEPLSSNSLSSPNLPASVTIADETQRQSFWQNSIAQGVPSVSTVVDLGNNRKGLMLLAPIVPGGKYRGGIFAVISLDEILTPIFDSVFNHRYFAGLFENGRMFFSTDSNLPGLEPRGGFPVRNKISLYQLDWDLFIWPQDSPTGFIAWWMMIMGVILSLMLAVMMWLFSNLSEQEDLNGAFHEILQLFLSQNVLKNRLRVLGDSILRVIGVDRCGIFSWDAARQSFAPVWISSDAEEDIRSFQNLHLEYGLLPLINRLVDERKVVIAYGDLAQELISKSARSTFKIKTLLALPLIWEDNLMGAVALACIDRKRRFSRYEKRWLESIGGILAVAMATERLNHQVQGQGNTLIQQQAEVSFLLNQIDENFRPSVISALGMLSLLKKECGSQFSPDGKYYLGRIQNSLIRMESILDDSTHAHKNQKNQS